MNIIADTNVVVRLLVQDDPVQSAQARKLFLEADTFTIPSSVMCEYVWVLSHAYKQDRERIASSIRRLMTVESVIVKDDEIEAGLALLEQGGDFADGVHAYAGSCLAPKHAVFASFDKKAVRLLSAQGTSTLSPANLSESE